VYKKQRGAKKKERKKKYGRGGEVTRQKKGEKVNKKSASLSRKDAIKAREKKRPNLGPEVQGKKKLKPALSERYKRWKSL